jgi:putative flippase GtrA
VKAEFLRDRSLPAVLSRFSLVGVAATVVYLVVSNLVISLDVVAPSVGSVVGYVAGIAVSFLGQSRMTFRVERNTWGQAVRFIVLSAVGLLFSYLSVEFAQSYFKVHPFWGTVATCLFIPLFSFVVMKFWVFREA